MANPLNTIVNSVSKSFGSLGGKTSSKKKTVRKPTKAQMKKYVYPMLKRAKRTAYTKGKNALRSEIRSGTRRPIVLKRMSY